MEILPIIIVFFLSLFITREIFFNRLNIETSSKSGIMGKLFILFSSIYGFLLVLESGFSIYHTHVVFRGSDGAGMLVFAPFLIFIPTLVVYFLGLVFSTPALFFLANDYLSIAKLNIISSNTSIKYYKYPVTIIVIVLIIIGPFLVYYDALNEREYRNKINNNSLLDTEKR